MNQFWVSYYNIKIPYILLGLNETALSELENSWKFLCGASGISQPLFPLLTQKDTTQVYDNKVQN